jgi:hypothetical protein
LTLLVLLEVQLLRLIVDSLRGKNVTNGATQPLDLIGARDGDSEAVPKLARLVAIFLEHLTHEAVLFCGRFSGEFERQIADLEESLLIGNVAWLLRPDDCGPVSRQSLFQHLSDPVTDQLVVAGDHVRFLFEEKRNVWVLLVDVTRAVVVQVEALLAQLLEAGEGDRAVEIRTNACGEQLRLGYAGRQ